LARKCQRFIGKDLEAEKEIEEYKKIEKEGIAEEDKAEHLEKIIPISTNHYLYLSGTPFRAISSGEFIEEQIFNWTYSDEQRAKENWTIPYGSNPYAALPRMVMLTYQLARFHSPNCMQGEFDGFDLNIFFSAEGEGRKARFKYEDEVQKWLDLIRGSFSETTVDHLKWEQKSRLYLFTRSIAQSIKSYFLVFANGCSL
jgi:hypothetical protein